MKKIRALALLLSVLLSIGVLPVTYAASTLDVTKGGGPETTVAEPGDEKTGSSDKELSTVLIEGSASFPLTTSTEINIEEDDSADLVNGLGDTNDTVKLILTPDEKIVRRGDYFNISAAFESEITGNAGILEFTYDTALFDYANNTPADGVIVLMTELTDSGARFVLMVPDYEIKGLMTLMLRAKEDVILGNASHEIIALVNVVVKDQNNEKEVVNTATITKITTSGNSLVDVDGDVNGDGVVNLIDLSNIVDAFGFTDEHEAWETVYRFMDFNQNGSIEISDIVYVAQRIDFSDRPIGSASAASATVIDSADEVSEANGETDVPDTNDEGDHNVIHEINKPTEPIEPGNPDDSGELTDPTELGNPADPDDSTEPTDLNEETDPTEQSDSTVSTEPDESTEPGDPDESTEETEPTEPGEETEPTEPSDEIAR